MLVRVRAIKWFNEVKKDGYFILRGGSLLNDFYAWYFALVRGGGPPWAPTPFFFLQIYET